MSGSELAEIVKKTPFEPFRLVMADGVGYDVRHPDLLMIGQRSAVVGLTGKPNQTRYEQTVKVDLFHIIRLESLENVVDKPSNGAA